MSFDSGFVKRDHGYHNRSLEAHEVFSCDHPLSVWFNFSQTDVGKSFFDQWHMFIRQNGLLFGLFLSFLVLHLDDAHEVLDVLILIQSKHFMGFVKVPQFETRVDVDLV